MWVHDYMKELSKLGELHSTNICLVVRKEDSLVSSSSPDYSHYAKQASYHMIHSTDSSRYGAIYLPLQRQFYAEKEV